MKPLLIIIPILLSFNSSFATGQDLVVNPFIKDYDLQLDFEGINKQQIIQSVEFAKYFTNDQLNVIINIPSEQRTFDNTCGVLDDIYNNIYNLAQICEVTVSTNPDKEIRDQASVAMEEFTAIAENLLLNKELYNALREYSNSNEGKALKGERAKFVSDLLISFKRNGFELSSLEQEELKRLNQKITSLSLEFGKNIAADNPFILFTEEEMNGMPEDFKKERKTPEGKYKVDVSKPSLEPFMFYSENQESRRKLYMAKMNRAASTNVAILEELVRARQDKAKLLGYSSYAAFITASNMSKSPEEVWKFLDGLKGAVRPKAEADLALLLKFIEDKTGKKQTSLEPYDLSYYTNKMLEEKFSVNQQEIKEYFETQNVIKGIFNVYQKIYQLRFEADKHPNTWHPEVQAFNVYDKENNKIGYFYLDLYPRADKYSHAACFNIINARTKGSKRQTPVAALVCNFPKATPEQPSLLVHRNVVTFFHEFGHLLHVLVSQTELAYTSGIMVAGDFVEAPSQIMENWGWDKEVLSLFAKHYKTGQVISDDLLTKMIAARKFNSGIDALQQIFYGTLDFTLHDKYPHQMDKPISQITKDVHDNITLFKYPENANFEASFGHLNGYGARYYGYLWSLVYAQDMFSVFQSKGLLNDEVGVRFRNNLLAKGGSAEAIDLVKEFLGREPDNKSFLKHLGLN